jgi:Caspase domain
LDKKKIIMRQLINHLILLGFAHALAGQNFNLPKESIAQRTSGAGGQDDLISFTTNWKGDIAAIGNAGRGEAGSQDMTFLAFDAQLNKLVERHIGRNGEDGAGQIISLPDGHYLLAGYSSKPIGKSSSTIKYHGERDGWILILDEKGDTKREILLGSRADDAFVAAAASPDGGVWLAGNSGSQAWIVRLSPTLDVLFERRIQYHLQPTQVNAATLMPDGTFFVVGSTKSPKEANLWVTGFDQNGMPVLEKSYPNSKGESGTGVISFDATTLVVVGTLIDTKERENGFICLIDNKGLMRQHKSLGGREYDKANALLKLYNDQLLVAGGSASFERGSRRISAWLSLVDSEFQKSKNQYYGSKLDDEAFALLEHPDGRLFAVGTTAKHVLKMRQGWLFQLTNRSDESAPDGTLFPEIHPNWEKGDDIFKENNRAFVPFSIENKGEKGQCNIRAEVSLLDSKSNAVLRLPGARSVLIPAVHANSKLSWGIPLQFIDGCPAGKYAMQVQFFQNKTAISKPLPFEVSVGKVVQPQLALSITPPEGEVILGKETFVLVEVQNEGNGVAKGLTLTSTANAKAQMPGQVGLGDLPPGEKLSYKLPVLLESGAIGNGALQLRLRVTDGSLLHSAQAEAALDVTNSIETKRNTENKDYTIAVWVYPNPDNFDKSDLVWSQEEITVQIKIVSNKPVNKQQFCLEINGEPCQIGAKFDEVRIRGDKSSKTFSQQIKLKEGSNMLRANIQTPNGQVSSDPLKIVYSPAKPNLHIVSIGVQASDLKYTVKDARDFANTLASTQNKAFGKIFLDTLLTEERTTKTEILKSLRRLQYRYNELQILPKDLLVIFVSGHGLGAYDGSFRLAASDYDSPFLQETSLDFEQEIVNYLQSLPCKKLFFVDACHSGTASGTGLAGIATRKNGLNMLVSCQPNEYSYEDDTWKNGAFTHALVRGLNAFSNQTAAVDTNFDSKLDAGELFQFIQKEVPELVNKKRPKASTSQHPNLFLSEPGKAVIIFQ